MKKRFEFEVEGVAPMVDRVAGAMSEGILKRFVRRVRREFLHAFDRATARIVAALVAAGLFLAGAALLVRAGVLGLVAWQVPPPAAHLTIGLLALIGGWLVIQKASAGGPPPPKEDSDG